jgi:CubicO group peptidase (beta-lactamase class C family)
MKLNKRRVAALKAQVQDVVDKGHAPACQYALAFNGEVVVNETIGSASPTARFAMWSATKPIFASLVWQLISEGKLRPETRVVDLWPEFGAFGKHGVTLDHLLLFTAGFPDATLDLQSVSDRAARVAQMEQWTLEWEPGSAYGYHGFSAHYVMAEIVQRVTSTDYRQALRARILEPLGLHRLELGVTEDRQVDILLMVNTGEPVSISAVLRELGLTEMPACWQRVVLPTSPAGALGSPEALQLLETPTVREAGIPGAGAVSDAASLTLFYQALLHNPANLWDPAVLRDVTSRVRNDYPTVIPGLSAMRTRGLELQGDGAGAAFRIGGGRVAPSAFGHGGAAGQIAWADPTTGISFAYLTNGSDRHAIRSSRRIQQLNAAVAACIE